MPLERRRHRREAHHRRPCAGPVGRGGRRRGERLAGAAEHVGRPQARDDAGVGLLGVAVGRRHPPLQLVGDGGREVEELLHVRLV